MRENMRRMRGGSYILAWAIAYTVPFPIVAGVTIAVIMYGIFGTPFLYWLALYLIVLGYVAVRSFRDAIRSARLRSAQLQLPPKQPRPSVSIGNTRKTPAQVNRAIDNFSASADPNRTYTLEEVVATITKNEGGYWSPSTIRKYILARQR